MIDKEKFYSAKETAIFLGVNVKTVYRLIQSLELHAIRIGFGKKIDRYRVQGKEIIRIKK